MSYDQYIPYDPNEPAPPRPSFAPNPQQPYADQPDSYRQMRHHHHQQQQQQRYAQQQDYARQQPYAYPAPGEARPYAGPGSTGYQRIASPYPQQGGQYGYGYQAPPPRKRRRVFLWFFLAVQALFVIWLVVGLATTHTGPTATDLAPVCYSHHWYPLFKSQADCVTHYGGALQTAGNAGKALGAGLIIMFWVVVDVLLGIGYGIYKLATR